MVIMNAKPILLPAGIGMQQFGDLLYRGDMHVQFAMLSTLWPIWLVSQYTHIFAGAIKYPHFQI